MQPINLELLRGNPGNPKKEAIICRNSATLFDFSFISRIDVTGEDTRSFLETLTQTSLTHLKPNSICYRYIIVNEIVISDITIWKYSTKHYEIMTGNGRDQLIIQQVGSQFKNICFNNLSKDFSIFAVQGPDCINALSILPIPIMNKIKKLQYYQHTTVEALDTQILIGRLGYTGEPGFEIICLKEIGSKLWNMISRTTAVGSFGAANILRIEAGFILFSNELKMSFRREALNLTKGGYSLKLEKGDDRETIELICFTAKHEDISDFWHPSEQGLQRPHREGEVVITSICQSPRHQDLLGLGFKIINPSNKEPDLFDSKQRFKSLVRQRLPYFDQNKTWPRKALDHIEK